VTTHAVADRQTGKTGGEEVAVPLNSKERRVAEQIERNKRSVLFYRWLNDDNMVDFLQLENERLERRLDAYTAVRLGTIKNVGCARSV
jgi:hypothetical protein